jgi:predicted DNA-binding transcriptional regulator AlpA
MTKFARGRRQPRHIPEAAPRRMLSREEAAVYTGVSASLFDQMVADGRMPKPTRINSRVLWDIKKLDAAIDALDTSDIDSDAWGSMQL